AGTRAECTAGRAWIRFACAAFRHPGRHRLRGGHVLGLPHRPADPRRHPGRRPHHGGDHLVRHRALVARPYTWWRVALVAAMAAGMVLALTIPVSRAFFDLRDPGLASDLIAL